MCALLVLTLSRIAVAQDVTVSGTVSSATGQHLQGVTVRIRGTSTSTTTDAQGKYTISAPSDAILVFNSIGYRGVAQTLGGRTAIDVTMEASVAVLPEVVVTGYMEEQR
ncbi:MAG TPA: carboxypeptidase-like regulatory domain-containing protein, partial [Gemmatimonadales bacterium]|nr:carboxypeptidase-like regulatory domain-containing protein [Gemmatimonadales bacterium]